MSGQPEQNLTNQEDDKPMPVRLRLPKLVLLAFHGTIAPQNWEDTAILPYVRDNLQTYLANNWFTNEHIANLVELLTQQSFDDHFVFERDDAPVIPNLNPTGNNQNRVIEAVCRYALWQLGLDLTSPDVLKLVRFCWHDGFQKKLIKVP